jgi:predicted nucleotidyltransferase
MVDSSIIAIVRRYLDAVMRAGIPAEKAVIYGSFARGEQRKDSDIDVLVLSPLFDRLKESKVLDLLWRLTRQVDIRIEPIAVGVREFDEDDGSPLIGVARRDGFVVSLPATAMVHEGSPEYGGRIKGK